VQTFDAYKPCGSCHRHVKRQAASCPFCGASRTATLPRAGRCIRNVSRAQWLVLGSTLVGMGCNGAVESSGAADGGKTEKPTAVTAPTAGVDTGNSGNDASDADDATLADAVSPAEDARAGDSGASIAEATREASSPWGPPNASCPRSGAFACGSGGPDAGGGGTCDRATQYCSPEYSPASCKPLSQLANATSFVDSGTCGSCPTCACIPPNDGSWECTCFEDNFGGLTVTCSQSSCYGSPPARVDRAPDSAQLTDA
jgi:hypothetical protein